MLLIPVKYKNDQEEENVFKDAIGQWIEYRTGQGYHVVPMASNRSATLLQKNIRNYAANHSVAAVVLIGDTGPVNKNRISSDAYRHRYVPTHYRKATVIAPYAGDQQIATDNPFGDVDGMIDDYLIVC